MTNDIMHTPTPEFRAGLEAEIIGAWRRETELESRRRPQRRRLRAAGLIAACLALGAVSGIVSAQARDYVRRDSLVDAVRAEMAILALRLDLARAQFNEASQKAKVGALDADGVALAESELRSLETRAARARLNIQEIEASSQAVRDELNAPLVGGRDFVADRIRLDLADAQQRLNTAERTLEMADRRVRAGAVSELARTEAQVEVTRANAELGVLAQPLALRREFIEKGGAAEDLARRLEAAQVKGDIRVVQQSLELVRARAANIERQRAVGAATQLDALRAQVETMERELELSRLVQQLKRLSGTP